MPFLGIVFGGEKQNKNTLKTLESELCKKNKAGMAGMKVNFELSLSVERQCDLGFSLPVNVLRVCF